jgi:hypothetical protein
MIMIDKTSIHKSFEKYLNQVRPKKDFLKFAAQESRDDVRFRLREFYKNPTPYQILLIGRSLFNSGTWLSNTSFRFLASLVNFTDTSLIPEHSEKELYILKSIQMKRDISYKKATYSEIFKTVFSELEFSFYNPAYEGQLSLPDINTTIVLISGVFNEVFSTPAFERGAKHLQEKANIKYFSPRVYGTKSCEHNAKHIEEQLTEYISKNPNENLWIIAFSKGGIDTLHFLEKNVEFSQNNIVGISAIASPILGSERVEHKVINGVHRATKSGLYRKLEKRFDFLFKGLQDSLSHHNQKSWFQDHYHSLPQRPFYTALALESDWYDSHIWMILTKLFFQSDSINDGIVDAENALYPDYFKGLNLGIIKGHHLIGTRSSTFSQEALLEAHIIFLNYLGLLN